MTSASSLRSSSPSKGSASAVPNEHASGAISEKMKSQEASVSNGALAGTLKPYDTKSSLENFKGSIEQMQEHQEKLQSLKQRKFDLEKLLSEKNLLLEQIQRQEQQIISGDYDFDATVHKTSSLNMRKKISTTSFKLPNNGKGMYATKERSGSVGDMEKKIRQEINAQLLNPPNTEFTVLKSKRNLPYNDYPPSLSTEQQYQAIPNRQIFQDLDCINLIAQPISTDANYSCLKPHDLPMAGDSKFSNIIHSPIASNGNPSQCCSPVPPEGVGNRGKYLERITSNVSSNYSITDRKNFIKAAQQRKNSPKQQRRDDRLSMVVNSVNFRECKNVHLMMPLTRSDLDVSSPMLALSSYDYDLPKLQTHAQNLTYRNDVTDGGAALVNFRQSTGSGNTTPYLNANCKVEGVDSTRAMQMTQQSHQNDLDEAIRSHQLLVNAASSSRQPMQILLSDVKSDRAYYNNLSDGQAQAMGLGGFWKTSGKERIWCRLETSYDCSSMQSNHVKSKNTNINAPPIKSVSLGNFDILNESEIRDEMVEKISISSMNSEGNKKHKEKHWLETSLDGPSKNTTKYLQRSSQPAYNLSIINQSASASTPVSNAGQKVLTNQSTQAANRMKQVPHSISGTAKLQSEDCQVSRKGSTISMKVCGYSAGPQEIKAPLHAYYSRAPSSASDLIPLKMAQEATSSSDANVFINQRKSPHPPNTTVVNQPVHPLQIAKSIQTQGSSTLQLSSTPPTQQPTFPSSNPRNPIYAVNLSHHDSIRIESPKNMTVVQQAIFMPYKEVTKPFEMSDFYKYSTKFRHNGKQVQQPKQQMHHDHQQSHQQFHQKQVEVEQ